MIALLALPLVGCNAVSAWLAGIDQQEYSWAEVPGTKHANSMQKDLDACEAPGAPGDAAATAASPSDHAAGGATPSSQGASAAASSDVPTIARGEDSPAVAACMADKGYHKAYRDRQSLF